MSILSAFQDFFKLPEPAPSESDLADMGLSRADYTMLSQSQPGTRARMEGIAARFGLSPADLDKDHGTLMEIAETCGQCPVARACHQGLAGKQKFDELLCPNALNFLEMSAS